MSLTRLTMELKKHFNTDNVLQYVPLDEEIVIANVANKNEKSLFCLNTSTQTVDKINSEYNVSTDLFKINEHCIGWISEVQGRNKLIQYDIDTKSFLSLDFPDGMYTNSILALANNTFILEDKNGYIHLYDNQLQRMTTEDKEEKASIKRNNLTICNDGIVSLSQDHTRLELYHFNLQRYGQIQINTNNKVPHQYHSMASPDFKYCALDMQDLNYGEYLQIYRITLTNKLIPLRQLPHSSRLRGPEWLDDGTLMICTERGFMQYDPRNDQVIELAGMPIFRDMSFSEPENDFQSDSYNFRMQSCLFMPDATILRIKNDEVSQVETPYTQILREQISQAFDSHVADTINEAQPSGYFPTPLKGIITDYNKKLFKMDKGNVVTFHAPDQLPETLRNEMETLYKNIQDNPHMDEKTRIASLSALESLKQVLILNDDRSIPEKMTDVISTHNTVLYPQSFFSSLWKKSDLAIFFDKVKETELISGFEKNKKLKTK